MINQKRNWYEKPAGIILLNIVAGIAVALLCNVIM
jgi:hypothetical protein